MKVTEIEVLDTDLSGRDGMQSWRIVLARVHTDEGITGLGEAAMAYGTGAPAVGPMILSLGERFVLGADPFHTDSIWETMLRRSLWAEAGGSVIFAAMSAIETALWDIKGRALGQPVHRLLGSATPAPLRCYASQLDLGWGENGRSLGSAEQYLDVATRVRAAGYDCVKVNPIKSDEEGKRATGRHGLFTPKQRDFIRKRMEAVREGLGSGADIIVELNSMTSTAAALQVAELVQDLGVIFIEEPTHPTSDHAHLKMSRRSPVPLATGERLYTRWGFLPYLEAGAVDMIQPDVCITGGIGEAYRIAHLAHTFDVGVQAHVCGSPLATAIALQFEASIPNFVIHEHHAMALRPANRELFEEELQPTAGKFEVPTKPGFGMTLRREAEAAMSKVSVKLSDK
ncbi:mandelate racemase/muconate lactonizing enzyme family protein [Cupriavidus consociatus]|uniref:mandelate racemase/muconate lactonizing enzyme family protein n=1 Tax=Cupriavidus consociatus TaxID=2821357 RepID=UPI001AE7E4EA|nr:MULTISPECIES: mandelate racemase/muconate lactonizing enzyme family protein [unclassified Cupriavidus]MBP0623348.1 mandelate racemase/muconate lactonizing enzyme family protein [Cupriavidus sp. LEh25]MDK2660046.1 mandelate racemase/muconate lactonizing enzyme family protein [Cupriavidus sp. LEh21]